MALQALDLYQPAPPLPLIYPKPVPTVGSTKLYRLGGLTGGYNLTHCGLVSSEAPFTGGYITIYNNQYAATATGPIIIDAVCVAPTQIANDGYNPIQGGAAGAWAVMPGGPWVVPLAKISYTLAGAPVLIPGFIKIPFTATSVPRTDITTAPHLLMFRIHVASGQLNAATPTTAQLTAQSNVYGARRPWDGFYKNGNFAASNQNGIGSATRGLIPALSVDFATSIAVSTAMFCGDSTQQGAKTVDSSSNLHDFNGPGMVACDALSTLTRPVYSANCGFQGYTVDQFTNAAEVWLNAISPKILVMQPWSINDPNQTLNTGDAAFNKARAILTKAKRSGIICFWNTAYPSNSTSAFTDGIRTTLNARCRADPDFGCIDYDSVMTNGANPAKIIAANDSGDGTHANNTGVGQMASLTQTAISPFV